MKISSLALNQLILAKLAGGEMRLLSLVVGVRKSLGQSQVKGDLSARVQSALRDLIASSPSSIPTACMRCIRAIAKAPPCKPLNPEVARDFSGRTSPSAAQESGGCAN